MYVADILTVLYLFVTWNRYHFQTLMYFFSFFFNKDILWLYCQFVQIICWGSHWWQLCNLFQVKPWCWQARRCYLNHETIKAETKWLPFCRQHFMIFEFLSENLISIQISPKFLPLTLSQHGFQWWFGAKQATSHYLNQSWHSLLTPVCNIYHKTFNIRHFDKQ